MFIFDDMGNRSSHPPVVADLSINGNNNKEGMRAAVLVEPGKIEIREVERPFPEENEVLIRVESCGVCASNVAPFEGRPWYSYPFEPGAPGHEACGRVELLGPSVTGWQVGNRVAFLSGHGFAEYDVAKANAIFALPTEFERDQIPVEPIGCVMNIFRRSGIEPGMTVAVVGIGFLGTLLIQLATNHGTRVLAFGRRSFALEFARKAGAAEAIRLGDPSVAIGQVEALTQGRLCEVVIEATGKQEALDFASQITCIRGRLVIAGYHQDEARKINLRLWNWRGLDVINAHERDPAISARGIREAIAAMQSGALDPRPLLTHTLSLDRLDEALALTRDRPGGFMKALIAF
jgi:threonine dehydrogenase-like Zn-dependent dehydrogenase